jgi:hypothetical protein
MALKERWMKVMNEDFTAPKESVFIGSKKLLQKVNI